MSYEERPIFMISECGERGLMIVIWGESALALLELYEKKSDFEKAKAPH